MRKLKPRGLKKIVQGTPGMGEDCFVVAFTSRGRADLSLILQGAVQAEMVVGKGTPFRGAAGERLTVKGSHSIK